MLAAPTHAARSWRTLVELVHRLVLPPDAVHAQDVRLPVVDDVDPPRDAGRRGGSGGRSSRTPACPRGRRSRACSGSPTAAPRACGRRSAGRTATARVVRPRNGRRSASRSRCTYHGPFSPSTSCGTSTSSRTSPAKASSSGSSQSVGDALPARRGHRPDLAVALLDVMPRGRRRGQRLRGRDDAVGDVPDPLLPRAAGDEHRALRPEELEQLAHVLPVRPSGRLPRAHRAVLELALRAAGRGGAASRARSGGTTRCPRATRGRGRRGRRRADSCAPPPGRAARRRRGRGTRAR